jgi:hypothetical protein
VGDFQLISLDDIPRAARKARKPGPFSLIQFPAMAAKALIQLEASVVADWITPRQAVDILDAVYDDKYLAKKVLLGRLIGGVIQAASGRTVVVDAGRKAEALFITIPPSEWEGIEPADGFWISGDLIYTRRSQSSSYQDCKTSHFRVRFDPEGVREIVKDEPPKPRGSKWIKKKLEPEAPPVPAEVEAPEPEQKGPAVSQDHLKAWFDLYQRAYSGSATDTEANAVASARGMFPGKSVSRERVRDLRGAQKRGRKADDAAK